MEVTASKVVVLLMLGTIKLVFGLAPLVLARVFQQKKKSNGYLVKKFIGSVLCIGGGVLLSTVFIHMLGEVRESMARAKEFGLLPKEVDYPFAELLFCVGFLLILFIESLVHKFCGGHCDDHDHGPSRGEMEENPLADSPKEMILKIPQVTGTQNSFHNPMYLKEFPCSEEKETLKPNSEASLCFSNKKVGSTGSMYKLTSNSYNLATDSLAIKLSKTPSKSKQARDERKLMSSVRGLLVVVALSVHSLFEGMAVGLEETTGGVWQLFLAISVHSIAVVFCIGTEMVSSGLGQVRIIVSMLILGLVTPLGVLVGMLLTHQAESGGQVLLVGVLQGMAGGTLLYITFFEVLNREKLAKYSMSGMVGALIILLSFTCMAALNSLGGHSHAGAGHVHGDAHHAHQVEYFHNDVKNSNFGLGQHHSHGGGGDHDHVHNIGHEVEQYTPPDQQIIQQKESHDDVTSSTPDHEYLQYSDKSDHHVDLAYDDNHGDHDHVFDYDTLH